MPKGLTAAVLLALVLVQPGSTAGVREGGIFRVSFQGQGLQAFDYVDPALARTPESWALLDTVCARLMRYRDQKPPKGYQLEPEVAATAPTISADGRTYTFRLRRGYRFSDGRPVRADAFAQAIHRTLAPGVDSPAWLYTQAIVGADDVRSGKAPRAAGVTANGYTLVVRFTREVRDFAAWTTMPFFCAVPPALPPDPEGVRSFPAAGPYVIREYRPGQRVTIRRNPRYAGDRERHVDGFDVDLSADSSAEVLHRIESGKADWGYVLPATHFESPRNPLYEYGLNKGQFWVTPGLTLSMYVMNSSRPLFHDNPELRQAVNLAVDRFGYFGPPLCELSDQYLPPLVPGYRDRRIYTLRNVERAKALAFGNRHSGKAIVYVSQLDAKLASAQSLDQQLAEIDLEVELRTFGENATTSAYLGRLGRPGEPWDLAHVLWTPDYVDPAGYINSLLEPQADGGTGLAGFAEEPYSGLMRQAARQRGAARDKAYAELDLRLGRDAAPLLPLAVVNEVNLVSARTACLLFRPGLVLTRVCLKR